MRDFVWDGADDSIFGGSRFRRHIFHLDSGSGDRGFASVCGRTLELLQESGVLTLSFLLDIY